MPQRRLPNSNTALHRGSSWLRMARIFRVCGIRVTRAAVSPASASAAYPRALNHEGPPSAVTRQPGAEITVSRGPSAQAFAAQPRSLLSSSSNRPSREVFGFALAGSLGDPTVGYPSWNFSLLSTVAFFGLHINWDGTIVSDSGLNVWNSSTLNGLLSTAHGSGTKVVLTIVLQDFAAGTPNMCAGVIQRTRTPTPRGVPSLAQGRAGF